MPTILSMSSKNIFRFLSALMSKLSLSLNAPTHLLLALISNLVVGIKMLDLNNLTRTFLFLGIETINLE